MSAIYDFVYVDYYLNYITATILILPHMDLVEPTSDDKNMEATTSNEDVLVVLQTESGEQIALPMSALPSDFVPGDSEQIIMVESALDEQQEVVVESSDLTDPQEIIEPPPVPPIEPPPVPPIEPPTVLPTELPSVPSIELPPIPPIELPPVPPMKPPHIKQKRKETLLTRPLNKEDMELEFQIIEEPSPQPQEVEVKRKPRKEYRTKKKVRLAMEKMSKEGLTNELIKKEQVENPEIEETIVKDEIKKDSSSSATKEPAKKETPKRELPKRGIKDKHQEQTIEMSPTKQIATPQPERRTRLSNTCRVATGKSYKCNDCDFSTHRINNIILHVKESCPKLKKT